MLRGSTAFFRLFFSNKQTDLQPQYNNNLNSNESLLPNLSHADSDSEVIKREARTRLEEVKIDSNYIEQIINNIESSEDLLKKVRLIEMLISKNREKCLPGLSDKDYLRLLGDFFSNEEAYIMPQYETYYGDIETLAERWMGDISKALMRKQQLDQKSFQSRQY